MADKLVGGRRFRLLMPVKNHGRENVVIEVGQ